MKPASIDHDLDLVLERTVPVPPEAVWDAWTIPEQLMRWFTPRPWRTTACDIDLRPGGVFRTVMQGPDGEEVDSTGCYLIIEKHRQLVFTDALRPGYRPSTSPFMTAEILMEPEGEGTRYPRDAAVDRGDGSTTDAPLIPLHVIVNWFDELNRLVPN